MYLCVCHALNERRVREALGPCGTVSSVFKNTGVRPRCTLCLPFIKDAVKSARQEASPDPSGLAAGPAE